MLFTLTYLFALFIPGWLITRCLGNYTQQILFTVSFSLAYFAITLFVCFALSLSISNFFVIYGIGIAGLLACSSIINSSTIVFKPAKIAGLSIVLISSFLYLSIVGFFDELPSDIYIHLEFFNQVLDQLQTNQFKSVNGFMLVGKTAQYWYHLPSLISYFTETEFLQHVNIFSTINVMVLLACIYEFAYWQFNAQIHKKWHLVITALLSTLFFALHFGINVFAFIRYYSIAPTILNYCIYLTSIVCLLGYYQGSLNFSKFFFISILLFFAAYTIHAQESLFIIIIYVAISAILFVKNIHINFNNSQRHQTIQCRDSVMLIFPLMVVIITVIYFYTIQNLELRQIKSTNVITLSTLLGFGNDFFLLNPYRQFYTVVTHWGFFIILAYVLSFQRFFKNQPVLLAGMLIPLITVFNPYFTNLFFRLANSDVLWRFLYMLPLYLVAARIVSGLWFAPKKSWLKTSMNYFLASIIFVLLLPINTTAISLPYSRIYSLSEVHHQARPVYWQDMLDFLHALPEEELIITDPVSGYLISALTKHHNRRYKFYRHRMIDPYDFDDYSDHPLKKYSDKLLVINQRKGMSTDIAKIARHWNPNNLKLTEFYNQPLIDHINAEQTHFELLWQADQIKIYRINY